MNHNRNSVAVNNSNKRSVFVDKILSILSCIHKTNVRLIVNLPNKVVSFIRRKYTEYKNKPPRTEINKVYVLVGYTTKQNIRKKYAEEKIMITFRRILLSFIFVLLLVLAFKSIMPKLRFVEYKQMFGIESMDEMTSNDPFESLTSAELYNKEQVTNID